MVDDRSCLVVVQRIQRVNSIWKLMIDQIGILDTMSPTDFLDFRDYLAGRSGFQSLQFRLIENKLGLAENLRIKYNQRSYAHYFSDETSLRLLKSSAEESTMVKLIEAWLERTPCLTRTAFDQNGNEFEQNDFLEQFGKGFELYIQETFINPLEVS